MSLISITNERMRDIDDTIKSSVENIPVFVVNRAIRDMNADIASLSKINPFFSPDNVPTGGSASSTTVAPATQTVVKGITYTVPDSGTPKKSVLPMLGIAGAAVAFFLMNR